MQLEENLITRVAVGDMLRRAASRYTEKTAVVDPRPQHTLRWSYQELNAQANRLAWALRALGLKKGDHVATVCHNCAELVATFYGTAKGGFVLVPLNPMLGAEDAGWIMGHAKVEALIVDESTVAWGMTSPRATSGCPPIVVSWSDTRVPSDFLSWEQCLALGSDYEVEDVVILDRDIYQIQYTSGSTAMPKGVLMSHLGVVMASLNEIVEMRTGSDSVVSVVLPMFHAGQQCQVFSTLLSGGTLVVLRGFEPAGLLKTIGQEKVTKILLLPTMYRALLDFPDFEAFDLSSLRTCVYGMAPMDERTLGEAKMRFGADFVLGSGQTEAYPPSNVLPASWDGRKPGNYWGMSTTLYDTAIMGENGALLPRGEIGEIVWRSPAIMQGYVEDMEATRASRQFGWHHSGDMGYIDDQGMVVFVDRLKDMIKSGGENVSSLKVEQLLLSHPAVQRAAVIGLPHRHWDEAVTAFLVPQSGTTIDIEQCWQMCRQHLSRFEVPKAIVVVDSLPLTSTGKIQKQRLRQQYRSYYQEPLRSERGPSSCPNPVRGEDGE